MPLNIVDVEGISAPISSNAKFHHHGTIKDAISSFKEEGWNIKEYFKYSIVRNPWDRYFSFFAYYKNKLKFYKETDTKLNSNLKRQKEYIYNLFNNKTDIEALKSIISKAKDQREYLIDVGGNMAMDKIGQLENITCDFFGFCKKVNISPIPKLLHKNKSDKESVTKEDLYTQELIDIVVEKEKWVIDKFGYDFNLHRT